jgi:hypothetical protein
MMTTLRARWLRAAAAIVVIFGSAMSGLAQTSGGTFSATLSPLVQNQGTFSATLTLTNLGPTLYSPLTISILRVPPGNGGSNAAVSFDSVVALPNGSLLPNETQNLTMVFPKPAKVGFTNTVTSVTGLAAPAGLGITVTTPTGGQTPAGPSFVVSGTVSDTGVFGASVDGVAGCVVGSTFFVNAFTPQVSSTSFKASANDIDGGQVTASVAISPPSKGLQVVPSPACGGVAPLTASLAISLNTTDGDSITALTVDFGTGAGPQSASLSSPIQNVYGNPGLYTVNVTAATALGATLTQSAMISVQTPAQAFSPILTNVSLLQNALMSQNVVRALSYHTYTSQSRYAPLLTQTGINLPGLGTLLSTAQPIVQVGNYAEVVVTATGTNGPQRSSVVLVRDGGGIWRVDSW